MKFALPIGLLVLGLTVGYFIGTHSSQDNKNIDSFPTEHITTQIVHDTVVQQKIVEIPTQESDSNLVDSSDFALQDTNQLVLDTLKEQYIEKPKDSLLIDEIVNIKRDIKLKSKQIKIVYLDQSTQDKDSLIKDVLDIKDVKKETIIIEFWESPIHFAGYKLSKSLLIVYDLSPQFDYVLYKKNEIYYLNFQSIYYQLKETDEFLSFQEIDKTDIF